MNVKISVFLFGKPAWELEDLEGNELPASYSQKLRELGKELDKRLQRIADIYDKLVANGWKPYGTLYDIDFFKEDIKDANQAREELAKLNISLEEVIIVECEEKPH
ncbi:MAG: hypothetical protein DRJ31_05495 [Candidatus Methanomethylicota archaeon]|uniref:Uncharacterized protein n=1 Tax=Thermoproteota archaeon TaxID=2056631 RepID=A0A497EQV4_9CREN|nr:MAG: hypothetical protein DRJ31_05495 [Candidatus Verstraetearchaeota archaeon]